MKCPLLLSLIFMAGFAGSLTAQVATGTGQGSAFQAQSDSRDDPDYRRGRKALDRSQWQEAIAAFDAVIARKGSDTAAALYWKAYALYREGERQQAISTVDALRQGYPDSRWLNDAQALVVEAQAQGGANVNPAAEADDDLKLIALNSLMQSDPNQAFPILNKLITGNASPHVKDRALFVLTQSSSPEAGKLLLDIAHGRANPELQLKAIRYIGAMGSNETRAQLGGIYESTSDRSIKRAILQSYMISGSRPLLLKAVKSETDPELEKEAIRQLALCGGSEELWQIYQSDSSTDRKAEILKSLFVGGDASKLVQVAQNEKNTQLRVAAIRSLGLMGGSRGPLLVSIYKSDQTREVREAVLNSLFLSHDGKSLVELARAETNPEMKREIVNKMALVHSKETTEYMMEILK